ncbi:MAG TPA: rhamnogalacturonan acetylesterase [Candidatus Sulfopaludibacter sp.]|jgi:lysophospholipase L1-like esterase|nr:rhamnogalacturonan acetylesterase [Candidatus Sulfopaludibacter sp.]
MRALNLALWCLGMVSAQQFDFGPGKIGPGIRYSAERGYGFEEDSHYFSVKVLDEGNYRVTVTFGNAKAATVTTVKAELRRLMLEKVATAPGQFETRSFIVNVRRPQIAGGGEVRLKDREKTSEAWAWDDKITLEFSNASPAFTRIAVEKAADIPTIYIAGDSTSTDQPKEPFNSWGQMLPRFFTPDIAIANHGESGESLKSFIGERRLAKVMSLIKPGDWLFIQMGHNDQKERGEGVGAFTSYKADLQRAVAETRQHQATPVLITSMNRLTFDQSGKITNSLGDYPEAVRQVAREERVALIDLNAMSKPFYEALGPVDAHRAFAGDDTTHHSDYGSYELAKCVVQGIKDAQLPIAKFLLDVPVFDPAHPDPFQNFDIPAEQEMKPAVFVVGDSTANNTGHKGWADPFADYFDPAKASVLNRARAGRSARTFFTEGLWDAVAQQIKPGDFVLIQFGHNDGGAPDQPPGRGDLPGIGDDEKDIANTQAKPETVHTFGWYLRKFIADTKAKGATPILLSPTVRNIWTGVHVERQMGHFAEWTQEVAKAENLTFLDESNAIADAYEKLGPEKVKAYFPADHTHTSPEGADLNASIVVATLKGAGSPLVAFLSPKGQAVTAYPAPLNISPAALRLPTPANPNLPALFLIGDSTVRNGRGDGANGQWGWGEPIVDSFDTGKINVVNRAVGGLSSRTYLTSGHWDHVLEMLKPGDFVMMQFGHNDNGPLDDAARARGTLKGAGEETREIDNPITRQHEVVHTYGWYLRKFIADARAKGATPVVCTLIPRKIWKDGKIVRNATDYAGWAASVAASEHVPLIDLNERIAARYDQMGEQQVEAMFADPHTHTSRAGAELNASIVIAGLKALPDNPLAAYLK